MAVDARTNFILADKAGVCSFPGCYRELIADAIEIFSSSRLVFLTMFVSIKTSKN
jgi:hypothetical protein